MTQLYGHGQIVFVDVKDTEHYWINIYLVKTDKANVKVVHLHSKQLHNENVTYDKSAKIAFYGVLKENRYKDKDGNFKSTGIQINAYGIDTNIEDIVLNFINWVNTTQPILNCDIQTSMVYEDDLPF